MEPGSADRSGRSERASAERAWSARVAAERGDFRTAYDELRAIHDRDALSTAELKLLADCAWWLGRVTETLTMTEEVHRRLLAEGQPDEAAMNALELGFHWMLRGDLTLGSGWVSRARRLLAEQPTSPTHGMLLYLEATEALEQHRLDDVVADARTLRRLGEQLGAPALGSLGLLCEGLALLRDGRVRDGFALLDEAMLPVVAGQVPPELAGNIYCTVISACHEVLDLRRAREWTEATERWCGSFSAAVMFLGVCRLHRTITLMLEGDWQEAELEADRVRQELMGFNVPAVAEAEYQLAELHRLRGDVVEARQGFARVRSLGREPQPGEALLALLDGDPGSGWMAVNAALARAGGNPLVRARLLHAQVELGIAAGQLDAVDRAVEELGAIADRYRTAGLVAWAGHARGWALLARDAAEAALPVLQQACHDYSALPARYDMARTQLLLARAHELLGEPEEAGAQRQSAEELLRGLGAATEVTPGPAGPLTARETEVLARVAGGATNREVAAALWITEKTVGRHLANIYRKLGVNSRTGAAAWAFEHRLGGANRPSSR